MKITTFKILIIFLGALNLAWAQDQSVFKSETFEEATPWTHLNFYNQPENFQFAIVTDRTGGHRKGVFEKAVDKLNLLMPEFVVSVGDLIEGYSKDSAHVNDQWEEFNGFVEKLEPPFFYVPGNHDFSNAMMKNQWLARYGRDYYYFVYKDVLFILMNTNDGDGVTFSPKQVEYVKEVLAKHQDVKWTFFFMHHPIWAYQDENEFVPLENIMGERPYSVFAGHTHRYMYSQRNNHNYYVLATTGGGSRLSGPRFGQFDHITWITMTDKGPKMINLGLNGLYDHDVSNEQTRELARSLFGTTQWDHLAFVQKNEQGEFMGGRVELLFKNTADKAIFLKANVLHHHTLNPSISKIDTLISPQSTLQLSLELKPTRSMAFNNLAPIEFDWEMGYETQRNEPPFYLNGNHTIDLQASPKAIEFTEMPIFLKNLEVAIKNPYINTILRYTLDGSEPNAQSPEYNKTILLDKTTTLKAKLFNSKGMPSQVLEKTYTKVKPLAANKKAGQNPGLTYKYYEGNFLTLPDFKQLKPLKTGKINTFDMEQLAHRKDHFAFLFEGDVEVPQEGIYTFYVHSDDGAKLFIDNQLVVDNDGSHSARTRKGLIALKEGKHTVQIQYFEDYLGEELRLGWEGPGLAREEIPANKFTH